jgi:hypothetical protein
MDDLIYILLGLAWIIYAAYRTNQKQKKKTLTAPASAPSGQNPPPREQPRPIDTILREILGEGSSLEEVTFPESQSYDEITVKELEKEKQLFSRPKTILETIPPEEGISAFDDTYKSFPTRSFIADEKEHALAAAREEDWFDLRKAVIYAEILNGPYR